MSKQNSKIPTPFRLPRSTPTHGIHQPTPSAAIRLPTSSTALRLPTPTAKIPPSMETPVSTAHSSAAKGQTNKVELSNPSLITGPWLSLMVNAANQHLDKLGLVRPITMADLDHLTPELFRKLIILLLCSTGDYQEQEFYPNKSEPLDPSGLLKMFQSVYYDPTVHHLFWRVKHLFPFNDDTFDYSILYFPAADPKRTKQVLKYITGYVYFNEQFNEKFSDTYNKCQAELKERQDGMEMIESLKTKLNDKIVELEEWENEMLQLEIDEKTSTDELQLNEENVAALKEKVNSLRKDFDVIESENIELELQHEVLLAKLKSLEENQVNNASITIQRQKDEKQMLEHALKERNEIGAKREKLGEIDNFTEKIIEEITQCASGLEEFVIIMQNAVDLAEKYIKVGNDLLINKNKLEEGGENRKKSDAKIVKMKAKRMETKEKMLNDKQRHIERLEQLQSEQQNLRATMESSAVVMNELVASETTILANIHKTQKTIAKNKHYTEDTIPKKFEELMKKTKAALEELALLLEVKIKSYNASRAA